MELLCSCPLKGQEFLFVGMIPLFSLVHHMASISDRMISPICLFLRQNGPEASSGGVSFQQERLVEVWKGQDRSLEAGSLEAFKSLLGFLGQVNMFGLLVLIFSTSEVIQGCCNFGKAFYEAPIMTYQAHKKTSLWCRYLGVDTEQLTPSFFLEGQTPSLLTW